MKSPAFFAVISFALTVSGAIPGQSVYEPYSFTGVVYTGASALVLPHASAVDAAGNIYVANGNDTILKIIPGNPLGVATVFAGEPGVHGSADGTGSAARFYSPEGIAVDASTGTIYVADHLNHTIRKITPAGVVTTFAGKPGVSGSADGTGAAARFNRPAGLAVDGMGNVYVADSANYTIRKITPDAVVTTLAGSAGNPGHSDGTGNAARFSSPWGMAVDSNGQVYVTDFVIIRKISPVGGVSTLAGQAGIDGFQDNQGCAQFSSSKGVAVDSNGNVFVADTDNSTIRKVNSAGVVTTVGGKVDSRGDNDGAGSIARFNSPVGVTLYGANQILVTNMGSSSLTIGTPVPQPTPMIHTVTNTDDSGPGSLRQALSDAQSGDSVTFSPSLNGQAISLTSGELTILSDISIIGPGADLLAVERSAMAATQFRIFNIPPNRNVHISGLTMRNGNAHSSSLDAGGAIYADQSRLAVDGCMFINNEAHYGGAICNSGVANVSGARGILTVASSTFQGNLATLGGGIFNGQVPDSNNSSDSFTYASVDNCTFSANAANAEGGAICNSSGNQNHLDVANSTFNGNYASDGTAIVSTFAFCSVGNSIFKGTGSGRTVVKDFSNPPFQDRGYNVLSDYPTNTLGTPLFANTTNQTNTDPRLGPLQNNGGHTLTHAPLVDSPAIDRGKDLTQDPCLMPFGIDQRGLPRPVRFNPTIPEPTGGDGSDVGAVELSGPAPTLGNISTRLAIGTGENVLIGGFVVEGSVSKKVLIRARGPSLAATSSNPLPNPRLELHDATSTIANNNDWQTTQIGGVITAGQAQEIENTGLAPSNAVESAIIATLPAGNYTAVVQDVSGATGVGIVEVFDLTPNDSSRLANISTRGSVQTGDNVMIGGIIVVSQPTRVIVRARGPSLTGGVSNPLPNPTLELHDQSNLIARNDDWQATQVGGTITTDQSQEIQNSGFAPANSAESAMIVTLQPGAYTAIVRDANGASGIGIVEVFILP